MSQDLKIILTPKADTSSKTVEQLNQQIKFLEKKLNSLNLKTNIDASALLTLTKNISIKQLKKLQRLPEMLMELLISNKLNTYPLSFVLKGILSYYWFTKNQNKNMLQFLRGE
ncbi:hypothetical protein CEA92_15265 [Bacillus velezensis]|nr:hypothetical protein [Bacillus velezensis]OWP57668.1 hypothetical protein CEA92_15265 [Bacillus velezensis]